MRYVDDPVLPFLRQQGEPVYVMKVNPTAENIARLIYDYTAEQGFPVRQYSRKSGGRCSRRWDLPS